MPSERSASNKANMTAKELRQKKAEIERQKKELERQERELAEAAEVERREAEEAAKEQERVRKAEEKQRRKTEEKRKAGEKKPKKSKAAAIIAVAAAAIIIACVLALSLGKDKPNDNMEASVLTTTPVIVTAGEPAIEPRPLNADSDASTVQNTEVRLSVDNSIKRSDTASTMTVNGTMETGASISVSGVELEGAVTQDSNAGTFSFTVKTANVGVYEAVITATKGDAVRASTVYLEHQPEGDSYMKGVYKMNYNNIKQYPTHKQGYKIVGKVTEVIQSTPYVKARIQTSDGDMIFCYYSGVAAIEARDGKTYELYGDPYGTDDASGLPQLHAWFILKRSGEPN